MLVFKADNETVFILERLKQYNVSISIYSFWTCSIEMWSFTRLKQNHWLSYRDDEYTDQENWINSKQFYIIKVMFIYLIHNLSQGEKKKRNVRLNLTIRMNKVRNEKGWKKFGSQTQFLSNRDSCSNRLSYERLSNVNLTGEI